MSTKKKYLQAAAGNIGSAWDISAASFVQSLDVSTNASAPNGVFFKPDGSKMFITSGEFDDAAYEYDLSTAWDISTASFVRSQGFGGSGAGVDNAIYSIAFKPDGTIMYLGGLVSDKIMQYSLSTPWNISTTTYSQQIVLTSQDTVPIGFNFKPDGTKLYVVGRASGNILEYDLGTAWTLSTYSFVQSFSVTTQESEPISVFFKDDGTIMYVLGTSGDDISVYDLSTPWDISTASYLQNFSVSAQDTVPNALFIGDDGRKMYISGDANDSIYEYDL